MALAPTENASQSQRSVNLEKEERSAERGGGGRQGRPASSTADGMVFIEGSNAGTVRATGKRYDHDWVMVFTVTDGRIAAMRHYYDPSEVMVAFRR